MTPQEKINEAVVFGGLQVKPWRPVQYPVAVLVPPQKYQECSDWLDREEMPPGSVGLAFWFNGEAYHFDDRDVRDYRWDTRTQIAFLFPAGHADTAARFKLTFGGAA